MITVYNDCNGKIMVNKVILRTQYIYSPNKETQHVEIYNLRQIFNIILNNKHYMTLKFGTLVVQTLKLIKMSTFITLKSIAFR